MYGFSVKWFINQSGYIFMWKDISLTLYGKGKNNSKFLKISMTANFSSEGTETVTIQDAPKI